MISYEVAGEGGREKEVLGKDRERLNNDGVYTWTTYYRANGSGKY